MAGDHPRVQEVLRKQINGRAINFHMFRVSQEGFWDVVIWRIGEQMDSATVCGNVMVAR